MKVLGIETSCDETSVAVAACEGASIRILHHAIASQIEQHRPFGGVVPELATRQHLLRLEPMMADIIAVSGGKESLDGVAVTTGPGLASSLLVGVALGKTFAFAAGKPWVGVNHLEGHLISPFLVQKKLPRYPHVALIVSGGHTLLVHAGDAGDYEKLGSTRDDAAGEAFDKVAKLMGLPYPGGPHVESRAREGNPKAIPFPRSLMEAGDLDFSFSGLKNSVRVFLQGDGPLARYRGASEADVCASFQQSVLDVLIEKTRRAIRQCGVELFSVSGGVSCNGALQEQMTTMAREEGVELLMATGDLSTDNAGMIAAAGALRLSRGEVSPFNLDADPNLSLAG